ncbi:MAG: type III-A CRISPR-associated RAMP protein Csm5 [Dehalococcoidia bacterium]
MALPTCRERPEGALHTGIASALLERERAVGRPLKKDDIAPSARFAAQPVERRLFGAQPRASGLRALRVSDAIATEGTRLALAAVRTCGVDEGKLAALSERLAIEVIAPGGRLVGSLTIDGSFLEQTGTRFEGTPNRGEIGETIALAREEGRRRAAAERAYFASAGASALVALFDGLLALIGTAGENTMLVQLGWGAGWDSKSFGPALTASGDWPAIREEFFGGRGRRPDRGRSGERPRPGERRSGGGRRPSGFPSTRKLADQAGGPGFPLGWALVSLVPVGEALPLQATMPAAWQDDAFLVQERGAGGAPSRAVESVAPASPFAALQALLSPQAAPEEQGESAPPPPIARIADRALKVGTILDAEVVTIEAARILVDVGRTDPAALDAATIGGGNLEVRYQVGQRLRVRVITPPPFFRIRLS